MPEVQIYLLGTFKILVDGVNIIEKLGGSRKKILVLQYLILNLGRHTTNNDLFDVLWPSEENRNPEGALKTLISRLRASLQPYGMGAAIVVRDSAYRWNVDFDAYIDVAEYEYLCEQVAEQQDLNPQSRAMYERILDIYQGDLLPYSNMDAWVVSRASQYHDKYLKSIYRYILLLKNAAEYSEVVRVCGAALKINEKDVTLNLELMASLVMLGRDREAMLRYEHTDNLHYNHLRLRPGHDVLKSYEKLIRIERESSADIEEIRVDLAQVNMAGGGAFVCEYPIFRDIYLLYLRNLKRMGISMVLVLVTVHNIQQPSRDPLMMDRTMKSVLQMLQKNLRRGDTVARYSASQYVILLPSVGIEVSQIAMERVRNSFYNDMQNAGFVLNYKLAPVEAE